MKHAEPLRLERLPRHRHLRTVDQEIDIVSGALDAPNGQRESADESVINPCAIQARMHGVEQISDRGNGITYPKTTPDQRRLPRWTRRRERFGELVYPADLFYSETEDGQF
jgi:hypothetical protein